MRVLVTGASGFLGRPCLEALRARGVELHALSSKAREEAGVRWHHGDLLDAGVAQDLMQRVRPSHLLHLAWYVVPGRFWQAEENLAWLQASLGLARAFAQAGGRRMVGAGTCAEYAWQGELCVEGQSLLAPQSLYGAAKLALGQTWQAYATSQGLSCAWGRLFFLHGPGEAPGRLVPSVLQALGQGQPAACTHGQQVRDFLSVQEAAEALVALLCSEVQGPVNVASGQPLPLAKLLGELGRLAGHPEGIQLGAIAAPAQEPNFLVADVRRLHQEVGWQPRLSWQEALAHTVAWHRKGALHGRA